MEPDPGMFRALIERCPLVTYTCDADNRITYISPQIEDWTGLPASRWTEDATHWHSMLHPDDRERVVTADFGDGTLDIEYRMRGRDGWLWIWELEVVVPDALGSSGICVDITALRQTREALEAARAQISAVVNTAPLILFAADPDGTITLSEGKALENVGPEAGPDGRAVPARARAQRRDPAAGAPRAGRGVVRYPRHARRAHLRLLVARPATTAR